jgi:hypothetical protein
MRAVTNHVIVHSPFSQPRAFISALLLLVQVLGLGHVALARHTLSANGGLVDAMPLASEQHDDQDGHLCAGDVTIHADAPDDCLVLAGWSSPSLLTAAVSFRHGPAELISGIRSASFVAVQLDALSRAPKASPPQG